MRAREYQTSNTRINERPSHLMQIQTFLHKKETVGLCTAYLVMTSRIFAYSSEVFRRADRRVGVL
jgi:hypothetical protein